MLGTAGAALAMLGPGLWSVDARLYGWKRLEATPRNKVLTSAKNSPKDQILFAKSRMSVASQRVCTFPDIGFPKFEPSCTMAHEFKPRRLNKEHQHDKRD
jgi:hypothetical protein